MSLQAHAPPDEVRCSLCAALAVGPCASCRNPVCGDCVELVRGSVAVAAVCTRCVRSGRASGTWRMWTPVLWWVGGVLLAVVAVLAAIRAF